jgi:uncharacterized lipoprotein YmbA
MRLKTYRRWCFLVLAATIAAGCATTGDTRYYLMSPVAPARTERPSLDLSLGVGPLRLADYLQRSNLVTRESPSRVHVAPDHKWGAALDAHLAEVLAEDLRMRLGLPGVHVYPWQPATRLDYQLAIDISHFIHERDAVYLDAHWQLLGRTGGRTLDGFSRIREPASADYDEVVNGMSRAVSRLADDIATRLRQQVAGNQP